jgi:hypothetical protein
VPFELEGEYGVLEFMHQRLKKNGICVIVIAEGAGQVGLFISSVNMCQVLNAGLKYKY